MVAEIVCVGTELLMGQIVNTNAQFLARELAEIGCVAYYQSVVGDNRERLAGAARTALSRADVVLFTGGLGPTEDDLTKETVAETMGMRLEIREEELERLKGWFASRGREMPPNNIKQARFPREARLIPNPRGTAPGCILTADGKTAVLLPGPPREMTLMFRETVRPYLLSRTPSKLVSRMVRIYGMGEGEVAYRLRGLISGQTNPTVATYCGTGEVALRVTAQAESEGEAEGLIRPMLEEIRKELGDVVYSENGETLPECCFRLLRDAGKTVSAAESCSGGLFADSLISIPGSSMVFLEGAVTYSEEAKMRTLGVRRETLERDGAVSDPCAREMAEGMRKRTGSDYAVSLTGFAGPDGGTEENPVGTVYVALAGADGTESRRLSLTGERNRVRQCAVLAALDLLRRRLERESCPVKDGPDMV